jgi:hypothetical protein
MEVRYVIPSRFENCRPFFGTSASVVRAVLLRPLANRDEDRLLYIRQSAPGVGVTNATFSIPEIQDIGSGLKSIKELGTFSEIDFTIVGLGTPREIPAGVVDGHYF